MSIESHGHEHELEPQYGLPERLPAGEHILWQGAPDFRTLALIALASLTALAWMTARTAVYTLTDKRVVMRIGIVLTLTFNIPLRSIQSAGLQSGDARHGDIALQLAGPDHIAFLHLWPHVRPWRVARPEPMLRAVADAPKVAALLSQAWSAVTGVAAHPAVASSATPPTAPAAAPTSNAGASPGRAPSPWQASPT